MVDKNCFEMKILAITANDSFARTSVAAFCAELDPTIDELNDIKTAVSEAFTNCVVHAYEGNSENFVNIKVLIESKTATIIISDNGCGIQNVEQAMQAFFTTKPDEERSGMGFTLMQTFMDEVEVESVPNHGTTVTLKKRF